MIEIEDTTLADFNYKLLNNILRHNAYLSKRKADASAECTICKTFETCKHLIYECSNVQPIWKLLIVYLNFNVEWRHIVVGFYLQNTRKTRDLNLIISLVA